MAVVTLKSTDSPSGNRRGLPIDSPSVAGITSSGVPPLADTRQMPWLPPAKIVSSAPQLNPKGKPAPSTQSPMTTGAPPVIAMRRNPSTTP